VSAVDTGKELARLDATEMGAVLDLAFTPDGKSVVSRAEDAKVRVWDLVAKKERLALDSRGWIGRSMALSGDGQTVAAGTVYNLVRVWDVASGKELSTQADGHDAPVRAVAFSPDGRQLVTGGANQQIRVWDAATLREVRLFTGNSAQQVTFSPDGRRLTSAWEGNNRAWVWDIARGETLWGLGPLGVRCPCAAFAPDGKSVVTASWSKGDENFGKTVLHVWDGASEKPLRELTLADLQPHVLTLSPDGKWAAVGGSAGNGRDPGPSLRLCDLAHNRERPVRRGDMSYVVSAAFSPDSRLVATGSLDLKARLWEVATGREILTLAGHERSVAAVAFAPGGRVLATADGGPVSSYWNGCGPQTIRFWDVGSGKELARLTGHASDVTSLAFTPDGKRFVTGLNNGTALIWETPTVAKPLATVGRKLGPKELAALWTTWPVTTLGWRTRPSVFSPPHPSRACPSWLRRAACGVLPTGWSSASLL
jgi:WD40 repeat protein